MRIRIDHTPGLAGATGFYQPVLCYDNGIELREFPLLGKTCFNTEAKAREREKVLVRAVLGPQKD